MKISEATIYPYPLLAPWSDDIAEASIRTDLAFREDKESHQLSIRISSRIDQPDIEGLVTTGRAALGCFVTCRETGLRRLLQVGYPEGAHDFAPGALLGRVALRPLVWATERIDRYLPRGAHSEFLECEVEAGRILALDYEKIIEVTRPPLPKVESLFDIDFSPEIPEETFDVDAGEDRIVVRMGVRTHALVQGLRYGDEVTKQVAMTSLFVPMVMTVLDQLRASKGQFEGCRWYRPFMARCEELNINVDEPDLMNDALKLLGSPFGGLVCLTGGVEEPEHG